MRPLKCENEIYLLLLFFFALVVRIVKSIHTLLISVDGVVILFESARSTTLGGIIENTTALVPPLFPILISCLSSTGLNQEIAGRSLSILFGALAIFPLYYLMKEVFSNRVAFVAIFFFSIHPLLIKYSADLLRDSTYLFIYILSLFIGWLGLKTGRQSFFISFGILATLGYFTKVEGLFVIPFFLGWVWISREIGGKKSRGIKVLSSLSVLLPNILLLISFFYLQSMSPSSISIAPGKPILKLLGLKEGIRYFFIYYISPENVLSALIDCCNNFLIKAISPILLILILFNSFRVKKKFHFQRAEFYLLSFILYHFVILLAFRINVGYVCTRYFLGIGALSFGWSSFGLLLFVEWLKDRLPLKKTRFSNEFWSIFILIIPLVLIFSLNVPKIIEPERLSIPFSGEWILNNHGPNVNVLTNDSRISDLARAKHFQLSEKALREIREGNENEIKLIVISGEDSIAHYEKRVKVLLEGKAYPIDSNYPKYVKEIQLYMITKNRDNY